MSAAPWPNAILMRLPRPVRGRYIARLVQTKFGVPRPVVLGGMVAIAHFYIYLGVAAVGGIVDALTPWGPLGLTREKLLASSFLGLFVLPCAAACAVAALVYRRMRIGLLRGQLLELYESARLRSCPN